MEEMGNGWKHVIRGNGIIFCLTRDDANEKRIIRFLGSSALRKTNGIMFEFRTLMLLDDVSLVPC